MLDLLYVPQTCNTAAAIVVLVRAVRIEEGLLLSPKSPYLHDPFFVGMVRCVRTYESYFALAPPCFQPARVSMWSTTIREAA